MMARTGLLPLLYLLFLAPLAIAQGAAEPGTPVDSALPTGSASALAVSDAHVAGVSSDATAYAANRAAFQRIRAELSDEAARLDESIAASASALEALRDEKARLQALAAEPPEDSLADLRAVTRSVERTAFFTLQPLAVIAGRMAAGGDGTHASAGAGRIDGRMISLYLSFLLPATIFLGVYCTRRVYPDFYARHRRPLELAALSLVLLLPLSSLAQDRPASAGEVPPAPALEEMLDEADTVLSLTRVQRYIRHLSAPDAQGKRIRISDVDLSGTPFTYFDSVVGGSGEYHATLAALHLADGNMPAAIGQLRALALPETRYATENADPRLYASIFSTTAAFLLRNDAPGLADRIVRLHMAELDSAESFERLYPALLSQSLVATADALAQQIIERTIAPGRLVALARTLYGTGATVQARAALDKALVNVREPEELAEIISAGLSQEDEGIVETAARTAPQLIDDLAALVGVADTLREAGRGPLAEALLDAVIERTAVRARSTVDGSVVSSTEALTFLSYAAFERQLLDLAERAAIAAVEPLSRVERSELVMPVPPAVLERAGVPQPERLVSPLYFALLYEAQGRADAAREHLAAASRSLLESLLESDGLYEPDMVNHLSLLGSRLTMDGNSGELASLDRVLTRLESQALTDMATVHSATIGRRQAQLDAMEAQIAAVREEIVALNGQLEARSTSKAAVAWSGILLTLRSVSLLALCGGLLTAVVAVALRHARRRCGYRIHAFWWKFVEGLGWVWVLSLFSAPLGLLLVAGAQLLLLYQERSERVIAKSGVLEPVISQPGPPASGGEAADLQDEQERSDPQWRNVIQMLRDTRNSRAS